MATLKLPNDSYIITSVICHNDNGKSYIICEDEQPINDTFFTESNDDETALVNIHKMFKYFQKEYGRCVGKMFIDKADKNKGSDHVGWVFQKRRMYDDCKETYLSETWVSLSTKIVTPTVYNSISLN